MTAQRLVPNERRGTPVALTMVGRDADVLQERGGKEKTMRIVRTFILAAAAAALAAWPAVAQQTPGKNGKLAGEVIEVRQSNATRNQGALTEIRVRSEQRQDTWLRLGRADEMGQRVQVGDRIRARVMAGGTGEPLNVHSLRNETTGEKLRLRTDDGTLFRQRDRDRDQTRDQARDRDRDRDRIHQPGSAGGQGGGHPRGGRP
jgi:hypothetical protein